MPRIQWPWLLGSLSYVILGVLRRFELTVGEAPGIILLILAFLSAGLGVILGVVSWKRQAVNPWWALGAIVFNLVMVLAAVMVVWTG